MITGDKEYDVYVLVRHTPFWGWFLWWLQPTYEIVLGQSFATAEDAAMQAQLKTNSAGGTAIGIAASALVCCEESRAIVG